MKKLILRTAMLPAAAAVLTSCGAAQITVPDAETGAADTGTVIYQSIVDKTDETDSGSAIDTSQDNASRLTVGIWWGVGLSDDVYYRINADGSGTVLRQQTGEALSFEYELDGTSIVFRLSDSESAAPAELEFTDPDSIIVDYSNGSREEWTYLGDLSIEEFTFYSNDELCLMARDYFKEQSGAEAQYTDAYISESGLIAIRLYDIIDDRMTTSQWYTVDRFTGQGTDYNDQPVDLTDVL